MPITIDPTVAKELEASMNQGGGVELPFAAPYLWVVNGNSQLRALGGAQYFGGWATKTEDLDALVDQADLPIPAEFKKQSIGTKDGGDFDAYTTRFVMVAPMGMRLSWISEGMHQPAFKPGARRHVQVLVLLATKKNDHYEAWTPAVLTAKGFQARNVIDSFTAWNRHSAAARKKYATGVPAWCFYVAIGTFGDKPVTKMVGKNDQSPITPIGPYLPKEVGEKELTATFIGDEVAKWMNELRKDAHDWLSAWNEPSNDAVEREDDGLPPAMEEPPDREEEMPF